jgi:hypothetical protein
VSVVLQLRRLVHARDCSTVARPGSLVLRVDPSSGTRPGDRLMGRTIRECRR